MWRNFICGELLNVKKIEMHRVKDGICALLLPNLFSSNLCCFDATPILSRFAHFLCGEKLGPKFCLWRKKLQI